MKVPKLQFHLPRGTTPASERRAGSRMRTAVDNIANDIVNAASNTPIGAHATKVIVGSTSITTDAVTALSWASAIFDGDALWSAGSPTRLTIVTQGIYQITAHVDWTTAGAGMTTGLYVNGSLLANDGARTVSLTGTSQGQTEVWYASFIVGDYVEIKVTRPATSPTTVVASGVADLRGTT